MSYPHPYQPRRSSIGCLGVFSVMCMGVFSMLNAGVIWWLDPNWAEPVALWKGTLLEPAPEFVSVGELPEAEQAGWWLAPLQQFPEPRPPARWIAFEAGRHVVAYDPARGATMELPLGGRLHLPPGAIGEACEVSLTPALQVPDNLTLYPIVSCFYDLKIGRHASYRFTKPVTLTLPYRPGRVPLDQMRLAVWQDGKPDMVPTTVDESAGLATGQLPHASPVALIGATAAASAAPIYFGSQTVREMLYLTYFANARAYVTENFVISFYDEGQAVLAPFGAEYGVTPDSRYRQLNSRAPREDRVPWWIVDVAGWLEEARAGFEQAGIRCPTPIKIGSATVGMKHRVFLTPLPQNALGETPLGGPIFLNNRLPDIDVRDDQGQGRAIRHTVVHELYHLAQDQSYSLADAIGGNWWIEMSAAYIGDWFWHNRSTPADYVPRFYVKGRECVTWNTMEKTGDPDHYAYASFLQSIDRRIPGGGLKLILAANRASETSMEGIDRAARESLGRSLPDLFADYAVDLYRDDMWHATLAPTLNDADLPSIQAFKASAASRAFVSVRSRPINSSAAPVANDYDYCSTGEFRPLTAKAFPILIEDLPARRKGRLVVSTEGGGSPVDLQVLVCEDRIGKIKLPIRSGSPGPVTSFPVAPQRLQKIFKVGGNDADRITLIVVNRSLSKQVQGPKIERWLLLAPAFCNWERYPQSPRTWKVTWHRAELRDYPQVFNGYEVWARKIGDPPDQLIRLSGTTDEFYDFNAPDDDDYVFAVRVQDKHLNHGEFSDHDARDPFQGEWSGRIQVTDGSVVKPIINLMNADTQKGRQQQLARIATLPPAEQTEARRQLDAASKEQEQFNATIAEWLGHGESIVLKVGVPIEFRIVRTEGKYRMYITSIFWKRLDQKSIEPIHLERRSDTRLRVANAPPEMPHLDLELVREGPNEIRTRNPWQVNSKVENEPVRFDLKWRFVRKSDKAATP